MHYSSITRHFKLPSSFQSIFETADNNVYAHTLEQYYIKAAKGRVEYGLITMVMAGWGVVNPLPNFDNVACERSLKVSCIMLYRMRY